MVKISQHLALLLVLGVMQNQVIHKEARVHQTQILQQGLEQTVLEVYQTLILEDNKEAWTLDEMKTGEVDKDLGMI